MTDACHFEHKENSHSDKHLTSDLFFMVRDRQECFTKAFLSVVASIMIVLINQPSDLSKIDVFNAIGALKASFLYFFDCDGYWPTSWVITGIQASGGSAVWNNAQDRIKAAKVQREHQPFT